MNYKRKSDEYSSTNNSKKIKSRVGEVKRGPLETDDLDVTSDTLPRPENSVKPEIQSRNKRMFGALMGHLGSARKVLERDSSKIDQQIQANLIVKEKNLLEMERLSTLHKTINENNRLKETLLREKLLKEKSIKDLNSSLETWKITTIQKGDLLETITLPSILWYPNRMNDTTDQLMSKRKLQIEERIKAHKEKTNQQIQDINEEITRIDEQLSDITHFFQDDEVITIMNKNTLTTNNSTPTNRNIVSPMRGYGSNGGGRGSARSHSDNYRSTHRDTEELEVMNTKWIDNERKESTSRYQRYTDDNYYNGNTRISSGLQRNNRQYSDDVITRRFEDYTKQKRGNKLQISDNIYVERNKDHHSNRDRRRNGDNDNDQSDSSNNGDRHDRHDDNEEDEVDRNNDDDNHEDDEDDDDIISINNSHIKSTYNEDKDDVSTKDNDTVDRNNNDGEREEEDDVEDIEI